MALDENIDEIRVELNASIKSRPMELDAVKIDPSRYKVVLENGLVGCFGCDSKVARRD